MYMCLYLRLQCQLRMVRVDAGTIIRGAPFMNNLARGRDGQRFSTHTCIAQTSYTEFCLHWYPCTPMLSIWAVGRGEWFPNHHSYACMHEGRRARRREGGSTQRHGLAECQQARRSSRSTPRMAAPGLPMVAGHASTPTVPRHRVRCLAFSLKKDCRTAVGWCLALLVSSSAPCPLF